MKFSLLSKRGNKQQTRSIDVPSDSTFAVSMRSKQQAEREEQQRIKELVMNYDLRDDDAEGESTPFLFNIQSNTNRKRTKCSDKGIEKTHNPYAQPRIDKAGNNRSNQRARKLQISDVNWYDKSSPFPSMSTSSSLSSPTSTSTSTPHLRTPQLQSHFSNLRNFPTLASTAAKRH